MHKIPKSNQLNFCILFNRCMLPNSLVKKDSQPLRTIQPTQDLSHSAEMPVSHDGLRVDPREIRLPNWCLEYIQFRCGFGTFCQRFYLCVLALGPIGMQTRSRKTLLECTQNEVKRLRAKACDQTQLTVVSITIFQLRCFNSQPIATLQVARILQVFSLENLTHSSEVQRPQGNFPAQAGPIPVLHTLCVAFQMQVCYHFLSLLIYLQRVHLRHFSAKGLVMLSFLG